MNPFGFNSKSTTDEVLHHVNLNGVRVLVTGVSSGLGVETARALAAHGADVVGAARDLTKAGRATADVRAAAGAGGGSFELIELDLASFESVHTCADRLLTDGRPFHVLIANAGVMATPFSKTVDGFETQFATNHLGHFLLVNRLEPLIADGGRLVNLSSNGHRWADVDLDDPNFEQTTYDPWIAYARSKTANSLFAVEYDRRHRSRGVRACALMPGVIFTGLAKHLTETDIGALMTSIGKERSEAGMPPLEFKTVQQGAATSVWAAVVAERDQIGGRYLEDCQVAPINDLPGIGDGVKSYAIDPERAKLLWAKSEELVGRHF